jgi:hypothetical protein
MKLPNWEEAFNNCDLGDKRRVQRAIKVSNQIDSKCDIKGVSALLTGHGELKAVSRLMKAPGVTPESLTGGFMDISCKRITSSHVLLVEDTSELNFAWRKKQLKGLGPAGNGEDQGFFIHPAIIIEPKNKEVQGIAALSIITRLYGQKTTEGDKHKRKDISDKESYRWIDVPRQGIERLPEEITKTIVADREADIYDLFLSRQKGELGKHCELLIRSAHNRKLSDKDSYLLEEIESWNIRGTHVVKIDGNGKRKGREAKCLIKFGEVKIAVPHSQRNRKGKEPISGVFVVDIREENNDSQEELLHWKLLTTWPVHTVEDAIEKIEWYRSRWLIEELFRILKSGYQVESVRFDDGNAIINWCALRLLMAVKLLYIRTHRDDEKTDSAKGVFSEIELEVLEACEPKLISSKSTRRRPEKYSIAWASLLVAIMGGYQALPSAKPFGQTTLWRGLIRLEGAVIGYQAALERSG